MLLVTHHVWIDQIEYVRHHIDLTSWPRAKAEVLWELNATFNQ